MKEYIISIDKENKEVTVHVPFEKGKMFSFKQIKKFLDFIFSCKWKIKTEDKISLEQMTLIHVMCTEYGEFLGYKPGEIKKVLKKMFCDENDIEHFSCSPYKENAATLKTAENFIEFIGSEAISNGCNLKVPVGYGNKKKLVPFREISRDIQRYVLSCLRNKVCCVCGAKIENDIMIDLHHHPPLGIPYELDDGKQTGFMSLCREHHSQVHNMGIKNFEKYYHLEAVWLNDDLIRELKKIYPNHFQNFKD